MQQYNQGQKPQKDLSIFALLLASYVTYKTWGWAVWLVGIFVYNNGFDPRYNSAWGFAAIFFEWLLLLRFFQFFIEEFVMARFYQDKAIRDAKRMMTQIEGGKAGFSWGLMVWVLAVGLVYFSMRQ